MITTTGKLLEGIKEVTDVVKSTVGGAGNDVLLKGHFTQDGVTVVSNIQFADREKDLGARALRDVSAQTLRRAGDGTSTACIILDYIVRNYKGGNLLEDLSKAKLMIRNESVVPESVVDAAIVAAKSEKIGRLIGEAADKVGIHGRLIAQDGHDDISVEMVDGYYYDKGFPTRHLSPHNLTVNLLEPNVILLNQVVEDYQQFAYMYDFLSKWNNEMPTALFIKSIAGAALQYMVTNAHKTKIYPILVEREDMFYDLAEISGAEIYGDSNRPWKLFAKQYPHKDIEDQYRKKGIGSVNRISVNNESTTVFFDKDISQYIETVDDEIRKSKLLKGVGIVRIGGMSQAEVGFNADRVDDSIRAAFLAFKGVVPGAGATLWKVGEQIGGTLGEAMKEVRRVIFANAALPMPEDVSAFDVRIHLKNDAIVDSTEVLVVALENAVSVANRLLNTKYLYYDDSEVEDRYAKAQGQRR